MISSPLPDTWSEWIAVNSSQDDGVKLDVLRGYIEKAARTYVNTGDITAEWANKKLPALGVAARLGVRNRYTLEARTVGTFSHTVIAADRAEAVHLFRKVVADASRLIVSGPEADAPTVTSGPEDVTGSTPVLPDNAPTMVGETLAKLRETIMLAHLAGPRVCRIGANDVLETFDLDPLPETKVFTVDRPITATARTVVSAFDEASAQRVAEWRWEDERSGYSVPNENIADRDGGMVVIASE